MTWIWDLDLGLGIGLGLDKNRNQTPALLALLQKRTPLASLLGVVVSGFVQHNKCPVLECRKLGVWFYINLLPVKTSL